MASLGLASFDVTVQPHLCKSRNDKEVTLTEGELDTPLPRVCPEWDHPTMQNRPVSRTYEHLAETQKNGNPKVPVKFSGAGSRTPDIQNMSLSLYQLSYAAI